MMKRLKRGTDNQAIGLLPLLLFVFMGSLISYIPAFIISVFFCFALYVFFRWWHLGEMFQFILYSVALSQAAFSIFFLFNSNDLLTEYSALIIEILFVIIISLSILRRRAIMKKARSVEMASDKQSYLNASLNEYFFTAKIIQSLYGFHLFIVLFYFLLPESAQKTIYEPFLFRHLFLIIGISVMAYEHIRLTIMRGYLKNEVWLPVLNDNGKVIGRIAHSISSASTRKFYHPVVRIAVVCNGMLYLTKRSRDSLISPNALDYPFKYYVRFKQGIEEAVYEALSCSYAREQVSPRFLIRYKFENELVKHQVSVYVVYINSEEKLTHCKEMSGKLWTAKQIEENLGTGLFSEYFEKEFTYLQNTVLMVENYCCHPNGYEVDI
ncbi:hypothetical protein [Massilibacteroides sp.]|uniref:hypothetical protein n=1 Tax=Massilibacteroides sp. TaxID=2034766 RepID=UPI002636D6E4|nr:hypothetical protein [Massilibacteroides sp.]MDD4516226.1 hypothetical protein [Massilibacteroides sp.]